MTSNKRKANEAETYNSSKVPKLPPSYAHLIPLAKITPDLQKWTRTSFPPIEVGGTTRPWLDVYFEKVHPRYPLLCEEFVRNNLQKLPMFLLHAMYALTLATSMDRDSIYSPGDYHYSHCKILFENQRHDPNPFFICGVMFMSIYQMMYTTAVVGGVSILSVGVRMAQELGIFRLAEITWTCSDGTVVGIQTGTSKRFLQLLSYFMYECDLYTSFLRKLPFLVQVDITPLADFTNSESVTFNDFYSQGFWRDGYKLLQIGQQVITFMRNEVLDIKGTKWNKRLNEIDCLLLDWFSNASPLITKVFDSYSISKADKDSPSYYAGYICCLYRLFRILLYKPLFLYNLKNESTKHISISIVRESTTEMLNVFGALNPVPLYCDRLPFFTYYLAYICGSTHALLSIIDGPKNLERAVTTTTKVMEHYAIVTPQISYRIQSLQTICNNPKEGIKLFGEYT